VLAVSPAGALTLQQQYQGKLKTAGALLTFVFNQLSFGLFVAPYLSRLPPPPSLSRIDEHIDIKPSLPHIHGVIDPVPSLPTIRRK